MPFPCLARKIGLLGVGLRADRDIFARRHRHGAGNQTGQTGDEDLGPPGPCGGHAHDQTGGRDKAIIRPQHRRAQPADAMDHVDFGMGQSAHSKGLSGSGADLRRPDRNVAGDKNVEELFDRERHIKPP